MNGTVNYKYAFFSTLVICGVLVVGSRSAPPQEKPRTPADGHDIHVLAPHKMDGKIMGPYHHYCKPVSSDVLECLIYESTEPNALLKQLEQFTLFLFVAAPHLPLPYLSHSMEFSGNLYHCLVPSSGAMRMSEQRKGSTQTVPPSEASSANREPSAKEQAWEKNTLQPTLEQSPERQAEFTTISGHPIRRLYTKADLPNWDPDRDLGFPGEPPYTRGIHSTMHRSRLC